MVQVVENRAEIEGQVLSIADDESRPGHKRATIAVSAVRPVESYPNLLAETAGQQVEVIIPQDAAGALKPGARLRCRARRTGPAGVFAESCTPIEP
ncbi:MAG: hypothetical protein ACJ798_18520 [Phenylobacterium sp.]